MLDQLRVLEQIRHTFGPEASGATQNVDPELSRMLNNNDVIGLLGSPKAKEIAQIIMDSGIIK